MPEYTYTCSNHHRILVEEGMFVNVIRTCKECKENMWRIPGKPNVNWGGLKPSQGELSPEIQDMVDREDERRDEYLETKEKHDHTKNDSK